MSMLVTPTQADRPDCPVFEKAKREAMQRGQKKRQRNLYVRGSLWSRVAPPESAVANRSATTTMLWNCCVARVLIRHTVGGTLVQWRLGWLRHTAIH